jgi:hypothetical protein
MKVGGLRLVFYLMLQHEQEMYEVTALTSVHSVQLVKEQSAEESIWILRKKYNGKMEKTVQLQVLYFVLFTKQGWNLGGI